MRQKRHDSGVYHSLEDFARAAYLRGRREDSEQLSINEALSAKDYVVGSLAHESQFASEGKRAHESPPHRLLKSDPHNPD